MDRNDLRTPPRQTRRALLGSVALVVAAAGATSTQAQHINRCQIDGRLVLQSAPCPLEARRPAAVSDAPVAIATVDKKKKALADLLRARDGAEPHASVAREVQSDGASILPTRMGAF